VTKWALGVRGSAAHGLAHLALRRSRSRWGGRPEREPSPTRADEERERESSGGGGERGGREPREGGREPKPPEGCGAAVAPAAEARW